MLLDVLSDPAGESGDPSLNTYLTPASDRVGFVGRAVGNVVVPRGRPLLRRLARRPVQRRRQPDGPGRQLPAAVRRRADGVGGTADDPDVDFGEDVFNPNEGFTGIEDTLSRLAIALTS